MLISPYSWLPEYTKKSGMSVYIGLFYSYTRSLLTISRALLTLLHTSEWLGGFTDKNGKAVVSKEEVRKALSGGFEFVSLYIVYVHTCIRIYS